MMRVFFHLSSAVLTLAAAITLHWLLLGESSPLKDYFLWHVGLPNLWGAINFIPGIVSILASGNVHGGSDFAFYVVFVIQWFFVGLVLSFVALLVRMVVREITTHSP